MANRANEPGSTASKGFTTDSTGDSSQKMRSVYKKSVTARPWNESGAVKAPKNSRSRAANSDLSINEEWMSLQTEPIFWIDFREHSSLLKLNESLSQIEAKIDEVVFAPIRAFKNFFKARSSK